MPRRIENKVKAQLLKAFRILESQNIIKNVSDECGNYEFGIDICFERDDIFGKNRKYGIQLKQGQINATNVEKTLGQLSVAFGHKFSLSPDDKHLDYIYVVTNGDISGGAKAYFNEANVGFRNIFLIEGNVLKIFLDKFQIDTKDIFGES